MDASVARVTLSNARIEGIIARKANVAVVFRRGPSRETQMLLWDLNTDEVTPGQWIRGLVNIRQCDLTSDGKLLVAGIYDANSRRTAASQVPPSIAQGWTAISRPPYFTALALWFDASGNGGRWTSDRDLHLFTQALPDKGRLSSRIRLRVPGQAGTPFETRCRCDGWVHTAGSTIVHIPRNWREDEKLMRTLMCAGISRETLDQLLPSQFPMDVPIGGKTWELPFSGGRLVRTQVGYDSDERLTLVEESGEVRVTLERPWNSWAWLDLDGRGRVVYGDKGCLWAWKNFPQGEPKLVADLNANRFEPIPPPDWAREWPESGVPEW